jgi:hypothetical protein
MLVSEEEKNAPKRSRKNRAINRAPNDNSSKAGSLN